MPVKHESRDYRMMAVMSPPAPEAERLIDSEYYVEGYATTFNDPYTLWENYKEIVDRNALDEADLSDVIMQYDHNGPVLARTRNGTLVLRMDDHGFKVAADLSKSEAARRLYEEITNGLIDRMSWAFTVAEESYDRESDTRRILKVKKVFDVAPVSRPANDATAISARSFVDGVIEEQERESRALAIEKLKQEIRIKRLKG